MTETALDRGHLGVLPRPTRLADESYLDFLESFRDVLLTRMFPAMAAAGHARMAAAGLPLDDDALPLPAIQAEFARAPIVPTWQRFMRSQQEMMWRRTRSSFAATGDAHLAQLEAAADTGPGQLVVDPAFAVPDYARREIHLQPGGYTDDPLGGIVYHYGTKVFYQGGNDQDELHAELADLTTPPDDGRVGAVLDLGCSVGQATIKLKARFAEAEVWGLDVGLPMVRYAHARAAEPGGAGQFHPGAGGGHAVRGWQVRYRLCLYPVPRAADCGDPRGAGRGASRAAAGRQVHHLRVSERKPASAAGVPLHDRLRQPR